MTPTTFTLILILYTPPYGSPQALPPAIKALSGFSMESACIKAGQEVEQLSYLPYKIRYSCVEMK